MKKVIFNSVLAMLLISSFSFNVAAQHPTFITVQVLDTNDTDKDEIYLKVWLEGQTEPITTEVQDMSHKHGAAQFAFFEIKKTPVKIVKIDVWDQDGDFFNSDDRLNGCENGTGRPCTEREKIEAKWEDSEYKVWWHVGEKGFGAR